jgi:hypothetical protein
VPEAGLARGVPAPWLDAAHGHLEALEAVAREHGLPRLEVPSQYDAQIAQLILELGPEQLVERAQPALEPDELFFRQEGSFQEPRLDTSLPSHPLIPVMDDQGRDVRPKITELDRREIRSRL